MGYRVIFLANPMKLSVKNEQLVIDNGEITTIPLEDIECIAADSRQISLNTYLLSKLSEYAVTFYVTDEAHHPNGVFIPVSRHSRHMSVLKSQIEMSLPAKKNLWRQIIRQKIENQASALQICGIDGWRSVDELKNTVRSGDAGNAEAIAAQKYFRMMFGNCFSRTEETCINAALNYGYAILRSTIEKYLIVYGYEPSLGLFHKSTLNNFNLADDIIEPFRPLVDVFVKLNVREEDEMTTVLKARLVNLLSADVLMDGKLFTSARAIDMAVQSLTGFISGRREDLQLPKIIFPEMHQYE